MSMNGETFQRLNHLVVFFWVKPQQTMQEMSASHLQSLTEDHSITGGTGSAARKKGKVLPGNGGKSQLRDSETVGPTYY